MPDVFPPLPADWPFAPTTPFTFGQAVTAGVSRSRLRTLVERGAVRRLIASVYVAASTPDSLRLRLQALSLVVPPDAVVTDESAGWLHGAEMVLAPGRPGDVPPVTIFQRTHGLRLRNGVCASGERRLAARDVELVGPLRVTTPLRTACDLGRLRHADHAIAALDQLLRLRRFCLPELIHELPRFKGFRGIVQLRHLAPLADPRAESPPESALRMRWLAAGLPSPEPQWEVRGSRGQSWWLDLAAPEFRYAAEYDGAKFHSTDEDSDHDDARRGWLSDHEGWAFTVVRRRNLYGQHQDCVELLRRDFRRHIGMT